MSTAIMYLSVFVYIQVDSTSSGLVLRLPPFARADEFVEAGNCELSLYQCLCTDVPIIKYCEILKYVRILRNNKDCMLNLVATKQGFI